MKREKRRAKSERTFACIISFSFFTLSLSLSHTHKHSISYFGCQFSINYYCEWLSAANIINTHENQQQQPMSLTTICHINIQNSAHKPSRGFLSNVANWTCHSGMIGAHARASPILSRRSLCVSLLLSLSMCMCIKIIVIKKDSKNDSII